MSMKSSFLDSVGTIACLVLIAICIASCQPSGPHKPVTPVSEPKGSAAAGSVQVDYADVKPIFQERCGRCHMTNPPGDWQSYDQISARVKSGVFALRFLGSNPTMPPPGTPESSAITAKERATLRAWANAGAPLKKGSPIAGTQPLTAPIVSAPIVSAPTVPAGDRKLADLVVQCVGCHGNSGISISDQFPNLAGQMPQYLKAQMTAFQNGQRKSPYMEPIAKGLSQNEVQTLADHFASLKPACGVSAANPAGAVLIQKGQAIAKATNCAVCHSGKNDQPIMPAWPKIFGQKRAYVEAQLNAFHSGGRTGSGGMSAVMKVYKPGFTDQDKVALAAYVASTKPLSECVP